MEFKKIELQKLWINYATKIGISGPVFPMTLKCPWCLQVMNFYEAYDLNHPAGWEIGFVVLLENNGQFHYKNWQPIHISCNVIKTSKELAQEVEPIQDLTILETLILDDEINEDNHELLDSPLDEFHEEEFQFDPILGIEVVDEIVQEKERRPKKIKPAKLAKADKPGKSEKPEKTKKDASQIEEAKKVKKTKKGEETTTFDFGLEPEPYDPKLLVGRRREKFEHANIQSKMNKRLDQIFKKRKF